MIEKVALIAKPRIHESMSLKEYQSLIEKIRKQVQKIHEVHELTPRQEIERLVCIFFGFNSINSLSEENLLELNSIYIELDKWNEFEGKINIIPKKDHEIWFMQIYLKNGFKINLIQQFSFKSWS